jgi:hypothetical protein
VISQLISASVVLSLLASSVSAQEAVFSRRVYAAAGRTFQQLWIWSASDGSLKPLTDSPRDHSEPLCSRDGKEIFFVSDTLTLNKSVWRVDRGTGLERQVRKSAFLTDTEGASKVPSAPCDSVLDLSWSPDRARLACTAGSDVIARDDGERCGVASRPQCHHLHDAPRSGAARRLRTASCLVGATGTLRCGDVDREAPDVRALE